MKPVQLKAVLNQQNKVWIGYKRLILKLSKVLRVGEVKGPYMHPNQRIISMQKRYDPHGIQLTTRNRSEKGL